MSPLFRPLTFSCSSMVSLELEASTFRGCLALTNSFFRKIKPGYCFEKKKRNTRTF
uniref:Uncharacterized protein n=1 Tax=Arundo donax TaxID=35708 RepID=A0A0A9H0T4_ARUDO